MREPTGYRCGDRLWATTDSGRSGSAHVERAIAHRVDTGHGVEGLSREPSRRTAIESGATGTTARGDD